MKTLLIVFASIFGALAAIFTLLFAATFSHADRRKHKYLRWLDGKKWPLFVVAIVCYIILAVLNPWKEVVLQPQIETASQNANSVEQPVVDAPITQNTAQISTDFEHKVTLSDHAGTAWSADFSSDGMLFSTGSSDGKVRVWETNSWQLKYELSGHDKSVNTNVNSVSFSPESQILVSGGSDKTIRIWSLQDGSLLQTLNAHTGISNAPSGSGVISVSFSKDGKWLVSSGFDGSILVWKISDNWMPFEITKQSGVIISAIFSPDGKYILSNSNGGGIQFWLNTLEFQADPFRVFYAQKQFISLAFSPDGSRFAGAKGDNEISIWNTQSWDEIKPLTDHENIVSSIFFFTDNQLVSGSYDNKVKMWNIAEGSSKKITELKEKITAVSAASDLETIAVCGKTVEIWGKRESNL